MDKQSILYWGDRLIVVVTWTSFMFGVSYDNLGSVSIYIGPLVVAVRRTYRPLSDQGQKLQK
jgi:hypothetical protein